MRSWSIGGLRIIHHLLLWWWWLLAGLVLLMLLLVGVRVLRMRMRLSSAIRVIEMGIPRLMLLVLLARLLWVLAVAILWCIHGGRW